MEKYEKFCKIIVDEQRDRVKNRNSRCKNVLREPTSKKRSSNVLSSCFYIGHYLRGGATRFDKDEGSETAKMDEPLYIFIGIHILLEYVLLSYIFN